jgi:signal transduction histidine kinase
MAFVASMKRSGSVLVGFGGLLLLMGALIFDSGRQIRDVNLDSSRLSKEYSERDALLDDLRTNIYHASTLAREYLLAPDVNHPETVEPDLLEIRLQNQAILTRYGQLVQPTERRTFQTLRNRIDAYLEGLLMGLDAHPAGTLERRIFYQGTVVPNRGELLRLLAQINAMDRRDMDEGEERVQLLHAHFQRRVEAMSLLALALSAGLAVVVLSRQYYLERKAATHFEEVRTARQDLRMLSNRLVSAQEEERRKLSRELHDQVGQSMTAMLMDLGRLESRLGPTSECRAILYSVRQAAEENVARVRDLALLLRPSMLDELGLVPALQWHVREVARRTGLRVKLIADEFDQELPELLRTSVYRIVQEALHNCVKHSGASEVRVEVHRDGDALQVSVQDNGAGFEPRRNKGLGLLGMEERAARLGGSICVESHPGAGAVLSVRLPLLMSNAETLHEEVA